MASLLPTGVEAHAAPFKVCTLVPAVLVAVQVIFWTMTQPVNKYWLQNTELSCVATHFFETGSAATTGAWTMMRDRWERSHVLRAIASVIAMLLLTTAVAL